MDPRFTRASAIADVYSPIRAATDTAFFSGLINHVLENRYHEDYVRLYTNASFIPADGYGFHDGLFSGYDQASRAYDTTTWDDERETGATPCAQGSANSLFAKVDPTLQHPRSVFQLMAAHYRRYTPELVSKVPGVPIANSVKSRTCSRRPGFPTRSAALSTQ